jgi:nitrate reductase gamma subunit
MKDMYIGNCFVAGASARKIARMLAGFALLLAPPAMAYVGPGAGLGVLAALAAIGAVIVATLVGLVMLPIRMIRKRRKSGAASTEQEPAKSAKGQPHDSGK